MQFLQNLEDKTFKIRKLSSLKTMIYTALARFIFGCIHMHANVREQELALSNPIGVPVVYEIKSILVRGYFIQIYQKFNNLGKKKPGQT